MAEIITVGEILVEIMANRMGQTFEETGEFTGPYASGAPAIFIDQASKTGSSCAIVAKVGDDGFGRLNVERLRRDGVDVRHIGIAPGKTTGIAFVTYNGNGDRNFIFTWKDSAPSTITREDVTELLFDGCKYFHIMGCSVFNEEMMEVFRKAISFAKARGAQVTFDPNIRKESMDDEKVKKFVLYAVENCDIFLPGEQELEWITGIADERQAVRHVLDHNAKFVVVKRGSRGSRVYGKQDEFDVAPFLAEEVDPTGAGDCYAATFISLLNQGRPVKEAARYASASGAVAVTKKGPMEGTATLAELDDFINRQSR
jgi:sugar/nucleoside kinase (ribokinase family)